MFDDSLSRLVVDDDGLLVFDDDAVWAFGDHEVGQLVCLAYVGAIEYGTLIEHCPVGREPFGMGG